jgi:hypothetical protein
VAKFLNVHGDKLKNLLRCPADYFDGRKTALAISPGQGPYLYSYGMNDALGVNSLPSGASTKITIWRAPSQKIMLTEPLEFGQYLNPSPAWNNARTLAYTHGIMFSKGNIQDRAGAKMGANVSACFIDGHVESINDDFACTMFQSEPSTQ